jgi:hypothetical protein
MYNTSLSVTKYMRLSQAIYTIYPISPNMVVLYACTVYACTVYACTVYAKTVYACTVYVCAGKDLF